MGYGRAISGTNCKRWLITPESKSTNKKSRTHDPALLVLAHAKLHRGSLHRSNHIQFDELRFAI